MKTTHGFLMGLLLAGSCPAAIAGEASASAADYPSLQAAIDANAGGTIAIPAGDHTISESLRIDKKGTNLIGFGRILQTNPEAAIVVVEEANDVVLRDLTLARPEGTKDANAGGLVVLNSERTRIENVRVIDNRSDEGAITLRNSSYGRIENCFILNYKRIGIDDRTQSPLLGYAFQCIDGTGISVAGCCGTIIVNNQIIEQRLLPTREIAEQHGLGKLLEGKLPSTFGELGRGVKQAGFARHWHQGSAIAVTSPEKTTFTRINGNYIENSAQGIDIHSDNFICTENTVYRGMMGMKAMHGSRYGIVARNIFSHVDNWAIMLGPGTASHAAKTAEGGEPARAANSDGSVVIANNVISEFGRGLEFWNWGGDSSEGASTAVFRFERGQVSDNPPLNNVLVEGNVITNSDEEIGPEGKAVQPKPRYLYAVLIDAAPKNNNEHNCPENIRIVNNLFVPGQRGLSNVSIPPSN